MTTRTLWVLNHSRDFGSRELSEFLNKPILSMHYAISFRLSKSILNINIVTINEYPMQKYETFMLS